MAWISRFAEPFTHLDDLRIWWRINSAAGCHLFMSNTRSPNKYVEESLLYHSEFTHRQPTDNGRSPDTSERSPTLPPCSSILRHSRVPATETRSRAARTLGAVACSRPVNVLKVSFMNAQESRAREHFTHRETCMVLQHVLDTSCTCPC